MNGLVSPVYIINGVVKAIPLIGKVLGGEKGEGVFQKSFDIARQICMASERSVQLTKQSINQSFEFAGFKKALSNSLEIDTEIESDESPERLLFNKIRKEQGLKKALEWRDSKFK